MHEHLAAHCRRVGQMSWQASQWAIKQHTGSGTAKVVLLVLAEAAGVDDAACFLSHETIAARAEISPRAAWTQMKVLAGQGLIDRRRRVDARGHRTSDWIVLRLGQTAPAAAGDAAQPAQDATRLVALTAPDDIAYSHLVPSLPARGAEEPTNEPVYEPEDSQDPILVAFERWWALYPKHVAKKAALKLFRAILKRGEATTDVLDAGAIRYSGSEKVRRGFVKDPTTWLNQGCWADEPDLQSPLTQGGRQSELLHAWETMK